MATIKKLLTKRLRGAGHRLSFKRNVEMKRYPSFNLNTTNGKDAKKLKTIERSRTLGNFIATKLSSTKFLHPRKKNGQSTTKPTLSSPNLNRK
jgi:hypothetical protein